MYAQKRTRWGAAAGIAVLSILLLAVRAAHTAPPSSPARASTGSLYMPLIVHQPAPSKTPIPPDDLAAEQSTAARINEHRQAAGLPALALDAALTQAARRHSRDMAEQGFTGHTGSDGSSASERVQDAGYGGAYVGEIIGWSSGGSIDQMVDWWMNSPPHRSLILSTWATDFGVGYTRDPESDWGHYWTVNFGSSARGQER